MTTRNNSSSKQLRAAALVKYREARRNINAVSRLDELDVEGEDDGIYEYVTEDDYRLLVESRRQREDFVVDDDGLGYYDDGEERFGDEFVNDEDLQKRRKRPSNGNAELTATALRKAKRSKTTLISEHCKSKNKSIWDFVNRGSTAIGARTASNISRASTTGKATPISHNVEALLEQLDDPHVLSSELKARQRKEEGVFKSTFRAARENTSAHIPPPIMTVGTNSALHHSKVSMDDCRAECTDRYEHFSDYASTVDHNDHDTVVNPSGNKPDNLQDLEINSDKFQTVCLESVKSTGMLSLESSSKEPHRSESSRRLIRPKLEKVENEPCFVPVLMNAMPIDAAKNNLRTTVANFSRSSIAIGNDVQDNFSAGQLDLGTFLESSMKVGQSVEAAQENYIDMFWFDVCERNGDVILFGKVQLPQDNRDNATSNEFVSACAVVTGNVRNLYVLPRLVDGELASMANVHTEINELLHKKGIIPRTSGSSWCGKPVERMYAFGDSTIPRNSTKYLKVVYDARFPVPSEEICSTPGVFYEKILGSGASVVENFILKRKFMGPCWIRMKNPVASESPLSWCKLEFQIKGPKQIRRLDLAVLESYPLPPPPVVCVTLKVQSVVNPKTHKSEIACLSVICHRSVQLDSSSSESPLKSLMQLTLIRPVTDSSGNISQFPRDIDKAISEGMPQLQRMQNERALLTRFLAQISLWDPDVVVGHNVWGFDMELILSRCMEHKLSGSIWSKIGRRRRTDFPFKLSSRKEMIIAEVTAGRVLCDTYLSAKELLQETTYTLSNLAATQLKTSRHDITPVDVPLLYKSSKDIVALGQATLFDAQLIQKLMFKLQILPLTKQLTCIAGNIWSHTLKGSRAERTEYLLLHEFHRLKYIVPEKRRFSRQLAKGKGGYVGGLVLEPKKGLYDNFILLLDFNSLYPSIIQEYNICFTTLDWCVYQDPTSHAEENIDLNIEYVPPIPTSSTELGVLPRVIKNLVERRKVVKNLLKNEKNVDKMGELDVRQKALKLTANSLYGCLGFNNSRFFARPIAALVTSKGRDILQSAVDVTQNKVGLEVIYGDTDSIMINTRLNEDKDFEKVLEFGEEVKREVNRLYKTLELEIDGVFRMMLLLKKKKYAAKTARRLPDGEIVYGEELKGLDLVRRDWCIQSKDTGRFVIEQILSGQDIDSVVQNIYDHLEELAKMMRNGELPLGKYIITKGLTKHPSDYPDAKSQPHVVVARRMIDSDHPVNVGEHIPYVITSTREPIPLEQPTSKAPSFAERARHPDEVLRSSGALKPDVDWYLTQQILPPIGRLCEHIEEISLQQIAEKLGIDGAKFSNRNYSDSSVHLDVDIDYIPASFQPDSERFKYVKKLKFCCIACGVENDFPGVFFVKDNSLTGESELVAGTNCVNSDCERPHFWGRENSFELYSSLVNKASIWLRELPLRYYDGKVRCDESCCNLETYQLSVAGRTCLRRGCTGRMQSICVESEANKHLLYVDRLFSVDHQCDKFGKLGLYGRKDDLREQLTKPGQLMFRKLHEFTCSALGTSAYNWISKTCWKSLFTSMEQHATGFERFAPRSQQSS